MMARLKGKAHSRLQETYGGFWLSLTRKSEARLTFLSGTTQAGRLFMAEDGFDRRLFAVGTDTVGRRIRMGREAWRVDPDFDEVPHADVPAKPRVGNLEAVAVFGMLLNAVDQGVPVGKSLVVEALFEVHWHLLPRLLPTWSFLGYKH